MQKSFLYNRDTLSGVEQPGSSPGSKVKALFMMNTKQKGNIAEHAAIVEGLKRGWGVSIPTGDYLPYDLIYDISGHLVRIQIKSAWFQKSSGNYVVDNRRTKTNRRQMKRERYHKQDFDCALVYLEPKEVFYIFPVEVFIHFGSEIHMVESQKRQRKPCSEEYRGAWSLLSQWAA